MNANTLVRVSAAIEAATGAAFIAVPSFAATMLLGTSLSGGGIAMVRLAGIALVCLGVLCWPSGDTATKQAILALFFYNLLAAFYFGYLRVGGGFVGYLLWPACIGHGVLALLLARPAYERRR
jgi:hypothetical protein